VLSVERVWRGLFVPGSRSRCKCETKGIGKQKYDLNRVNSVMTENGFLGRLNGPSSVGLLGRDLGRAGVVGI
jgi:hypothetical protein